MRRWWIGTGGNAGEESTVSGPLAAAMTVMTVCNRRAGTEGNSVANEEGSLASRELMSASAASLLLSSMREAGAGKNREYFGGRQRIVPATQKWGPLVRASLRSERHGKRRAQSLGDCADPSSTIKDDVSCISRLVK